MTIIIIQFTFYVFVVTLYTRNSRNQFQTIEKRLTKHSKQH